MLSELKTLHADLLTQIDELERLTRDPVPSPNDVATARLKLTKASRRRTNFLDGVVYPALLSDGAIPGAERVRQLRDDDRSRLTRSSNHIAKWTLSEILADWTGYREASLVLRAAMRNRIREEQVVLYPLLQD